MRIKETIVVEGRYDKNSLSQVVDAHIVELGGFAVFNDKEKISLLRKLAETRGIIVLTDSDSAGFLIRSHLKGAIDKEYVKHAYIPDIYGKERRKQKSSKEGKIGVEGVRPEVLREALIRAGATVESEETMSVVGESIKKSDLFEAGLTGMAGSAERRSRFIAHLGLPERLSTNALLDVLNALYNKAQFEEMVREF